MFKPELLAPAGNTEKLRYALAYGADAVYAGIPKFSLRARENDFNERKLKKAIHYTHQLGKKIYLTMNIYPHNRKVKLFTEMLDRVADYAADGLIMADPGMILLARERHPHLNIHLSTQANTINWQTVRFWQQVGLKRIILSRELRIDEIKEIKQQVPEMELETFIHGAICIAYSGRCLLSNYFNHRDANQGTCTNACRWQYKVHHLKENNTSETSMHSENRSDYFLEETERPGSLMPVDEDEHGTYIMNAKDLSTIEIIDQLVDAGIDSLKIEGRTKSVYYLSVITRAYRKVIDACLQQNEIENHVRDEVYTVANRGYVTGFLQKNPLQDGQNYEQSHADHQTRRFVGIVDKYSDEDRMARVKVRNRFATGDRLELISPHKTIPFQVQKMTDQEGDVVQVAHGGGKDIWMSLSEPPSPFALLRKITEPSNRDVPIDQNDGVRT
ncbi:MAG: tRNA 5-hydroxyuridine modification protein YegQ [Caldithrix sp.]|nr:tRNA 5-hydroxyuridine modification protein YegQ [Caldithrix sp.]